MVDLDNVCLRVVDLDVFCIWQGCVVKLDAVEKGYVFVDWGIALWGLHPKKKST